MMIFDNIDIISEPVNGATLIREVCFVASATTIDPTAEIYNVVSQ